MQHQDLIQHFLLCLMREHCYSLFLIVSGHQIVDSFFSYLEIDCCGKGKTWVQIKDFILCQQMIMEEYKDHLQLSIAAMIRRLAGPMKILTHLLSFNRM